MTLKLSDLINMPRDCVYAIFCDDTKRFVVGYTKHLLGLISRINEDLETPKYTLLRYDIDKVEIRILEQGIQDNHDKKLKVALYHDEFIAKGYTSYYPSSLVRYKVGTDIMLYLHHAYYTVYLETSRKEKVVVGLFKKESDMIKFKDLYYKDGIVKTIYYADNLYTRNHLVKYGYGIKELSKY